MGVRHMTGTPWHLETLHKADDRRDKRQCVYYSENYCKFYCETCRGSAHCEKYESCVPVDSDPFRFKVPQPDNPIRNSIPDVSDVLQVGSQLLFNRYAPGSPKRYSKPPVTATVISIKGNDVVIEFKKHPYHSKVTHKSLHYPQIMRDVTIISK